MSEPEPDHGFTRSVRTRLGILAILLLLGIWGDSRSVSEGPDGAEGRPSEASPDRVNTSDADRQGVSGADDAMELTLDTLGMTRDEVIHALGDELVWQQAEDDEDTWIGTGDWTYVVLSGNPLDLSGVHLYHKTPEYVGALPPAEQDRLHQTWRRESLQRVQGFVHRLMPEWRFDELQRWTSDTAAGFEQQPCDPYCMDFILISDRIVMLAEYPDETLSVGLFSLGDFLIASGADAAYAPGMNLSIDDVLAGLSVGETFVLQATPEFKDGLPIFVGVDRRNGTRIEFKGDPLNLRNVTLSVESGVPVAADGDDEGTTKEAEAWLARFLETITLGHPPEALDRWLADSLDRIVGCEFCSPTGFLVDDAIELRVTRAGETLSISAQALGP